MYSGSSKSDIPKAPRMAQNVHETINDTAQAMQDSVNSAADNVSRLTGNARRQIRENPVQSALIALGAGYILGKIF